MYRKKLLPLVDYHLPTTISSTFLRKKYPFTCSVELIDILAIQILFLENIATGCDPAGIIHRYLAIS